MSPGTRFRATTYLVRLFKIRRSGLTLHSVQLCLAIHKIWHLFRLISDYLLMTKEDLELWGEDPEEFACEETGDRCAQNLIIILFDPFP